MSDRSAIEWTDATWNPVRGCTRISPGCGGPGKAGGCYAEKIAARFSDTGQLFHGFAERSSDGGRWTGKIALIEDKLTIPLHWKKPRRIFVNSMSDLFHENLPDEAIDRIFAIMALCPRHTFQVLTKRAERMRAYMAHVEREAMWMGAVAALLEAVPALMKVCHPILARREPWLPLPNVWLGVSAERQEEADERIPLLLQTPAAVRFVSLEPLLGQIDLTSVAPPQLPYTGKAAGINAISEHNRILRGVLDWVIIGGESGPHARPMHPDWARALRDQCAAAGVPFFFKQWGEWAPFYYRDDGQPRTSLVFDDDPAFRRMTVHRIGKANAGRLLDGVEHNGFPG